MEELWSAQTSTQESVSAVVVCHRAEGVLTWRLLHEIEREVLGEAAFTGKHPSRLLNMLRVPAVLDYPKGDRIVSFEGHDFVPLLLAAIDDAWRRVN
jgi:hypothetical protein